MYGIPGSGKSYVAYRLSKTHNIPLISSDGIREELFGRWVDTPLVYIIIYERMSRILTAHQSVIFDAANLQFKYRKIIPEKFINLYTKKILIMVEAPIDICLIRNKERSRHVPFDTIVNMYLSKEYPQMDEYDEIYVIYT